jgi:hypothetical protein
MLTRLTCVLCLCTAANPERKNGRTAVVGEQATLVERTELDSDEVLMLRIRNAEDELKGVQDDQVT